MYGRQDDSGGDDSQVPPWLVRAEVTIRRGNATTSETVPAGTTVGPDTAGIRMICRWNTSEPDSTATPAAPAAASPPLGGFGFQRGNILFTSTPPERPSAGSYTLPRSGSSGNDDSISSARGRANDSGYTSEQHPHAYSSLPTRRPSQQYNRRCKSTCSIVLQQQSAADGKSSPSSRSPRDSWQHRRQLFPRYPFSAVPEVCEDCAEGSAASSAFTTHFCTRVAEKSANRAAAATASKDAASQTTDIESARSSSTLSRGSRVRRRPATAAGQSDEKKKEDIRSPPASAATGGSAPPAPLADSEKSDSSTREDSKRKSRTVHIDVYCTGSDDDLSVTDTSSDDERSTPMTVFENEDVRITHTQATNNLPRGFEDENAFLKRTAERRCASFRNAPMRMPSLASSKGYDSDEVLSSLYPSRFSSYTALRDLDSAPWSAASSSTAVSCDSATMTSSKDTDIESLLNSTSALTPCESFEYANSTDRERIRRMDLGADREKSKTWRSPQIERRQLLRNKKMKEYFEKHEIAWSSADSAEESDESGPVGWSGSRAAKQAVARRSAAPEEEGPRATRDHAPPHSVLRDRIGPFGSKSPSPLPSTIPSRVTSPFTTPHGERTEHIAKASVFGAVISAFRKPGHHIGPAKNPSCLCEHCRRFFEEEAKGRSSSLSELERHPGFKSPKE
ncbi:PREDICTED: mucin-19 isoform X2 [Dinoponera quadriceps]|uniref:Mucin-19 isoform X2 n=1 Tax=Dinoponera quadriceps TaxID=609295 RepID=A0A6P3XWX3_DINQU|nr:PREDICTED: mucin-19 isoform X2 [Dinoponera quadriceps]